MRYLGLDLGTRTLGLAISDSTGTIASVYDTIHFDEDYDVLIPKLKEIASKENIDTFVLGLPKNMNNTIGERGEETIQFGEKLKEHLNVDVVMQDERLTTVSAHNLMLEADLSRKKRKKHVDQLAASIILQTYLDRKKGMKEWKNN